MVRPIPLRRPINWWRLRTDEAERIVHERAQNTENVIISDHAYERSDGRSQVTPLYAEQVYDILATGSVDRPPSLNGDNEWKVIIVKRMPGTREAGVVTLFTREDDTLFVMTIQWMDWLK